MAIRRIADMERDVKERCNMLFGHIVEIEHLEAALREERRKRRSREDSELCAENVFAPLVTHHLSIAMAQYYHNTYLWVLQIVCGCAHPDTSMKCGLGHVFRGRNATIRRVVRLSRAYRPAFVERAPRGWSLPPDRSDVYYDVARRTCDTSRLERGSPTHVSRDVEWGSYGDGEKVFGGCVGGVVGSAILCHYLITNSLVSALSNGKLYGLLDRYTFIALRLSERNRVPAVGVVQRRERVSTGGCERDCAGEHREMEVLFLEEGPLGLVRETVGSRAFGGGGGRAQLMTAPLSALSAFMDCISTFIASSHFLDSGSSQCNS
ncbi:hypothetical protein Tco_0228052 [Tanacetum coccineum]